MHAPGADELEVATKNHYEHNFKRWVEAWVLSRWIATEAVRDGRKQTLTRLRELASAIFRCLITGDGLQVVSLFSWAPGSYHGGELSRWNYPV